MAGIVRSGACLALLALPTVLAFFSGGFFGQPRLWAGVGVWVATAVVMLTVPRPFPRSTPARLSLLGLIGLAVWTTLSVIWAPQRDPALADAERVTLYAGFALCSTALLRGRWARALEPVLAGGAAVVCGYALTTRLLPGVVDAAHGVRAGARLDQPLTYWNALGALAAIGLVLAVRLAADPSRRPGTRLMATAIGPALGLALYLTVSRGALAALVVGLVVLVALVRDARVIRATVVAVGVSIVAAVAATRFPGVDTLSGSTAARRWDGAAMLAVLLALCATATAIHLMLIRREGRPGRSAGLKTRLGVGAAVAVALVGAALLITSGSGPVGHVLPTDRSRLRTIETNRGKYWNVALAQMPETPLRGVGSRGFADLWLRERPIAETALDAHSLYIETATELGLVGLTLLLAFVGGAVAAAVRLQRADPTRLTSAGWLAAASVFTFHAAVDWDWEMPAVTLVYLALVSAILGTADGVAGAREGG